MPYIAAFKTHMVPGFHTLGHQLLTRKAAAISDLDKGYKKVDYAALLRAEGHFVPTEEALVAASQVLRPQQSKPLSMVVAKQSIGDILGMVYCVNECSRGRNSNITMQTRADAKVVCDWSKFDDMVTHHVRDPKLLRNKMSIRNWVIFHVRKGDIHYDSRCLETSAATTAAGGILVAGDGDGPWSWKPRRKKMRTRVTNSVTF
jgi:hypothetical protein